MEKISKRRMRRLRLKAKANVAELLAIADRAAAHLKGTYSSHDLYDENGLPGSDYPPETIELIKDLIRDPGPSYYITPEMAKEVETAALHALLAHPRSCRAPVGVKRPWFSPAPQTHSPDRPEIFRCA
jgi:hypothetical protein